MGLCAYFYRTRKKQKYVQSNSDSHVELAYFRNNRGLEDHLNSRGNIVVLDKEDLELIKSLAKYDDYFNKDFGEGQSVMSVIDEAIDWVDKGHVVYYIGGC